MSSCGKVIVLGFVVAACAALAPPARAQETATPPAPVTTPAPAPAAAPQPACALATSYNTCRAACREMFPPKPKVETTAEALDRTKLRVSGWWTLGTGAALLVAGGIAGGVALHLNGELHDECPGGSCPPAYHGDLDERDRLAVSSTVLLGAGVAATAVGVLILTVFSRPPKGGTAGATAALSPVAAPGGGGAVWTWRF